MRHVVVLLGIALSASSGLGAATVPLAKIVDSLMRDLGADPYDVRERATATLRKIGAPARVVLEKAVASDDPEIRVRARQILADIKDGIRPHWPAETILVMRHFASRQEHERYNLFKQISGAIGHEAVPFIIHRMAVGTSNEGGYALRTLQAMRDERAWKQVLELIVEPANDPQTKALAWARGKSGQTIQTIEKLARDQIKAGDRNEAVEKAIEAILAQLKAGKAQPAATAAAALAKTAPEDPRALYLEA